MAEMNAEILVEFLAELLSTGHWRGRRRPSAASTAVRVSTGGIQC